MIIKLSVLALLLAFLLLPACGGMKNSGAKDASTVGLVVDMHCHVAGIGAGDSGCFVSEKLRKSWKYRIYLKAFGISEKEIMQHGDAVVIERLSRNLARSKSVDAAVVLAMDGVIGDDGELDRQLTEIYIPNEYMAKEVRKYDNLYFGASINPYRPDALERLDRAASDGAVLVKWLPSIQHIDPADERLVPFYLRLKELGLPLLTHAGDENSFTDARNELGDPARLHLPLKLGVTVIVAHAATTGKNDGIDNMERLLPMFAEYPNLYTDISSLTQINKMGSLARLLESEVPQDRLLYGTDMPLLKTGIASPLFFALKLPLGRIIALAGTDNPWDQDFGLKRELGVPAGVFTNAAGLLNLQGVQAGNISNRP